MYVIDDMAEDHHTQKQLDVMVMLEVAVVKDAILMLEVAAVVKDVVVMVAFAVVEDTVLMVEEATVEKAVEEAVVMGVAVTSVDMDVITNSTRRLTSSLTSIPNIIIVSSFVPTQSYILINSSRRTRKREAKSAINCCTVLIV